MGRLRQMGWFATIVLAMGGGFPQLAFGGLDCNPLPGSCSAPPATCATPSTTGTDSCGGPCGYSIPPPESNGCDAPAPSCTTLNTTGTDDCNRTCTFTKNLGSCSAPAPACGQTTTGTWSNCPAIQCTKTGSVCTGPPTENYVQYGYALPGDPVYGFPEAKDSQGNPLLPDVISRDLVGLAAKGNIVIGDYTSTVFRNNVLPNIRPYHPITNPNSKTQPYVIDPTDEALGYHSPIPDLPNPDDPDHPFPRFDGNYDALDGGVKMDDSDRRFYESSLPNAQFQATLNMPTGTQGMTIDAILYTNHALAGMISSTGYVVINGAMVSRDDGFVFNGPLRVNHDIRLLNGAVAPLIVLPMSMQRLDLSGFQECGPTGCGS